MLQQQGEIPGIPATGINAGHVGNANDEQEFSEYPEHYNYDASPGTI